MKKLILSAVGDMCLARSMPDLIEQKGFDYPFKNVQKSFNKADVLMGNLESVYKPDYFPDENSNEHFQALSSSVELNQILVDAGFDVINQATNHALDCGLEGLKYTSGILEKSGFAVIGAGETESNAYAMKIVEKKGVKIGFSGYTDPFKWTLKGGNGCVAYFDENNVVESIKVNKDKVDILIISWHTDLEFSNSPSIPRYDICHKMIDAGANAVICHHPHVPQGVEEYNNGVILYSLGNFLFDTGPYQKKHCPVDSLRTFIFNIEIENKKIVGWNREYYKIIREKCRPEPLSREELKEFEKHFKMLDELAGDRDKVRKEWHRISQYWLNESWEKMTEAGPEKFIENWAWSSLSGNGFWRNGILDMAKKKYDKHKYDTYNWVRPYFPFEDK